MALRHDATRREGKPSMKRESADHDDLELRIVAQAALLVLAILNLIALSVIFGWT